MATLHLDTIEGTSDDTGRKVGIHIEIPDVDTFTVCMMDKGLGHTSRAWGTEPERIRVTLRYMVTQNKARATITAAEVHGLKGELVNGDRQQLARILPAMLAQKLGIRVSGNDLQGRIYQVDEI